MSFATLCLTWFNVRMAKLHPRGGFAWLALYLNRVRIVVRVFLMLLSFA